MADVRLNIFQDQPLLAHAFISRLSAAGRMNIKHVYIPGSISFNNVAMIMSASGTTAKTLSISFGLYSLNGATLSLANSASQSINPVANQLSWITLVTSATQDITPGDWFLAFNSSTSNNSRIFLIGQSIPELPDDLTYGGPFFRGFYSVTTAAFPASIATSNMSKEGDSGNEGSCFYPFILISA